MAKETKPQEAQEEITFDYFMKVDLRVGKIFEVEPVA